MVNEILNNGECGEGGKVSGGDMGAGERMEE